MSLGGSRRFALAYLALGLIPLVSAPSLSGCNSCSDIGCASGATLSVDWGDDVTVPAGTVATACFNDVCVSAVLPTSVPAKLGSSLSFPTDANVRGTLWSADVNRDRVEVTWSFPDGKRFLAGDRYRLTVTAPSGDTIAETQATALGYDKQQPNGSGCPPTCYVARFP